MSDFGDFDNADAFDTEPADPEQVAIRYHKYRRDTDSSLARWEDLTDDEKRRAIELFARLLAWLVRQGAFR